MGGLWSSSERSLLSLHVWGAGRSTNIPELGFGTARIHSGHRFCWPGCSSERSDPGSPAHLTLSPGHPSLGSSPQLSHWETPVKIFPEGSRQLQGPFGPIPVRAGGSSWGHWCDVAAGLGRLCPCAEGPAWHQAAPGTLMSLQPPHRGCSFSLSSPRPCSEGRRTGE